MLLAKDKLEPHNGKKTDPAHPALYPTGILPKSLEARQGKVYDLVVKRFFATFGEPAVRETVVAKLDVNKEIFVARGTRTVAPNWHVLYAPYVRLEEEELPAMKQGESLGIKKIELHAEQTKPPKRYTPASLIRELEKLGLGTKATRAEIVETLQRRNYVTGEAITVTQLGMETIIILEKYSPKILDQELTKRFEEDMESIREGKKHQPEILKEAREILTELLAEFKTKEAQVGQELLKTFSETKAAMTTVGACHACKDGALQLRMGKFGRFIACSKYPDCKTTFKLPAGGGVVVTADVCKECQFPMVKMIRKAKKPQELCINLDCTSKKIPDVHETTCTKCKEGKMILRKSIYGGFLACNRFPKCRNIAKLPKTTEETPQTEKAK